MAGYPKEFYHICLPFPAQILKYLEGVKAMKAQIREIGIDRISPNLRCIYAAEHIEELARGIALEGQLEPIHIWFAGDEFRIIDGEKRWRACRSLGMATIKAVITEVEAAGV